MLPLPCKNKFEISINFDGCRSTSKVDIISPPVLFNRLAVHMNLLVFTLTLKSLMHPEMGVT